MNAGNIEFRHGSESHSSTWGKFYVRGLDEWKVKEATEGDRNDSHHTLNTYVCNDIPEGTLFTIFEQSGDKRGADSYFFTIAQVDTSSAERDEAVYNACYVQGNFKIIVRAEGKTKAPRLLDWWANSGNPQTLEFAQHCAAHIDRRGVKNCPPFTPPETPSKGTAISPSTTGRYLLLIQGKSIEINGRLLSQMWLKPETVGDGAVRVKAANGDPYYCVGYDPGFPATTEWGFVRHGDIHWGWIEVVDPNPANGTYQSIASFQIPSQAAKGHPSVPQDVVLIQLPVEEVAVSSDELAPLPQLEAGNSIPVRNQPWFSIGQVVQGVTWTYSRYYLKQLLKNNRKHFAREILDFLQNGESIEYSVVGIEARYGLPMSMICNQCYLENGQSHSGLTWYYKVLIKGVRDGKNVCVIPNVWIREADFVPISEITFEAKQFYKDDCNHVYKCVYPKGELAFVYVGFVRADGKLSWDNHITPRKLSPWMRKSFQPYTLPERVLQ